MAELFWNTVKKPACKKMKTEKRLLFHPGAPIWAASWSGIPTNKACLLYTSQNEIAYPAQEVLTNTEAFVFLPAETSTLMDKLWTEILSNDKNYSKWTIPAFLLVGILFSIGINVRRMILKKKENLM